MNKKIALVTGGARRIGAEIVRELHANGFCVIIHYHHSDKDALNLADELNLIRQDSARIIKADLLETSKFGEWIEKAAQFWGGLDVLVNNASSFYPTPIASLEESQWDELFGCNLKAPFFLAKACVDLLSLNQGCIINIVDIYAKCSLRDYPIYSLSKAGLVSMTQVLARELAPKIRINAVAPGAILWPEHDTNSSKQAKIVTRIPLKKSGEPSDIVKSVLYLIEAPYVTGQILAVDGGRSLAY